MTFSPYCTSIGQPRCLLEYLLPNMDPPGIKLANLANTTEKLPSAWQCAVEENESTGAKFSLSWWATYEARVTLGIIFISCIPFQHSIDSLACFHNMTGLPVEL